AATSVVKGFNLMGVRYRSEVCIHWIENEALIEEVLQNLGAANFDPEFFATYEQELVNLYNEQHGANLRLKRRKGLRGVFSLLRGKKRTPSVREEAGVPA
ncbi:MAG: hypothetical protein AAFR59_03315, partial [Bacteroidota bacterium]